jgi:TalC/MipB family fructose-6-phosphate aldolase
MALYVDSAYLDDVAAVCASFPIAGVTTNPTILLAAFERGQRLDDLGVLRHLLTTCTGPIFMQPTAPTADELRAAGLRYMEVDSKRVVLKLPMTAAGMRAAMDLHRDGARFAFTAVASVAQAYSGALTGAEWIIPYFCRMRRAGIDASSRVGDMERLLSLQHSSVRILAASLKAPADIVEATLCGAHDVTVPPDIIRAMTEDPLSHAAVETFTADWERLRATVS